MSTIFTMNWQTSFPEKKFISGPEINDLQELLAILFEKVSSEKDFNESVFFSPKFQDLYDPEKMTGLKTAVKLIKKNIKEGNRIMIYGDFDTDGITSTVILTKALQELGAKTSYRIPDRIKHSHGLNKEIIDEIIPTGTKLIVTCDCGINDQKLVDYARSKEIQVIITDHHTPDPKRKPQAEAVLNPLQENCPYPEKNLSGAGVAFKLIQALVSEEIPKKNQEKFLNKYLEIAAIGLIGDCVPITGECRTMVKLGLAQMKNSAWPGLKEAIKDEKNIDEISVSFNIAPKLNAASRLGNVQNAMDLFLGKSPQKQHEYLTNLNQQRKFRTQEIFAEALSSEHKNEDFIFIKNEGWEIGILGLVASKFCEKFHKPSFLGSQKENGNWAFSVRGVPGISVIEALRSGNDLFEKVGGHAGAAGFEIQTEKIPELEKTLIDYFKNHPLPPSKIQSQAVIEPALLTLDLISVLENFKPFGMGNSEIIFEIKGVEILETKLIGKEQNHLKILTQKNNQIFEILGFFKPDLHNFFKPNERYNLFFSVSVNEFRGQKKLQLKLVDFNLC